MKTINWNKTKGKWCKVVRLYCHWKFFPQRIRTHPSNLVIRWLVNNTGGVEQWHFIYISGKCCFLVSHCFLTLFLTFGCWLFWTDLFYCQSSVTSDLGWKVSSPQSLPLLIPPIVKIYTTLLPKLLPFLWMLHATVTIYNISSVKPLLSHMPAYIPSFTLNMSF